MSTRGTSEPWLAAAALPLELGRQWARDWPAWFGPARVPLPRAPHKSELAWLETPLGAVVAKRARLGAWKRPLASLGARVNRPERAFRLGCALRLQDFATPEPLAVLGRGGEAVLVTRYVDGLGPWEFLRAGHGLEVLLATLAEALARLHAAGFRHRDMKASNLLLQTSQGEPRLVWTDLDGLRPVGTVEPRLRAQDLGRLAASFESAEARAAGVRAGHWPELVGRYLALALGRAPGVEELEVLSARIRRRREQAVRRHLARGAPVN